MSDDLFVPTIEFIDGLYSGSIANGVDPMSHFTTREEVLGLGLALGGDAFKSVALGLPYSMIRDLVEMMLHRREPVGIVFSDLWRFHNWDMDKWRDQRLNSLERYVASLDLDPDDFVSRDEAIADLFAGLEMDHRSPFTLSQVASAFGVSLSDVQKIVFPVMVIAMCAGESCHEAIDIQIGNMTDLKEFHTKGTIKGKKTVCPDCWNSTYKQLAEVSRRAQEQRVRERKEEAIRMKEYSERLKTMPYREYLQTDHWKSVRKAALRRAGYKCQLCNSDLLLQVHHRTYKNRGHEQASDVIALCQRCHKQFHGVSEEN